MSEVAAAVVFGGIVALAVLVSWQIDTAAAESRAGRPMSNRLRIDRRNDE